jgi:hypothetical protein
VTPPHVSMTMIPQSHPQLNLQQVKCFGCGRNGHRITSCPEINDLISRGLLTHNHAGHVVWPDGHSIRRFGTESFVEAFKRESHTEDHFIVVNGISEPSPDSNDQQEST